MKTTIIIAILILLVAAGVYYFVILPEQNKEPTGIDTGPSSTGDTKLPDLSGPAGAQQPVATADQTVIGKSAGGRDITAYHYGSGEKELIFVGGIHGGYEWNTVLVAYQLMDYLNGNKTTIPASIKITVIPALNPDGLFKTVGTAGRFSASDIPKGEGVTIPGRYNQNGADLNRNFDCEWSKDAVWQTNKVNPGTAAFSEPESRAVRDYVTKNKPAAAVVWYSSYGGVFSSNCRGGILPETREITKIYADASGYPAFEEYNFYAITGDMVNWLAKNNIPGISVLLSSHEDTEWAKNLAGVKALLARYSK